jgi:hypothetical protein
MSKPYSEMTAWEIATYWYSVDEIHRCILAKGSWIFGAEEPIPEDTKSREFAEWLTEQYRLAMAKGVDLARNG